MTIRIWHGVYDISKNYVYCLEGYFNKETQQYLPINNKLRRYLMNKGIKFSLKYNVKFVPFILGRDSDKHIEVISICHTHFDDYDIEIGEDIVVGRIKRMRGDIKEIVYETEWFEKTITLYSWIDKTTGAKIYKPKTIMRKRLKLDDNGNPIVKIEIPFIPYNLSRRHQIKQKDGTYVDGKLMYPYIYKMGSID
ncbi:hypothetical protein LCGC14_0224960 [marine sediment metagenome]|uniref:Uncharacterized protein n=1 Tax=marine sediment metagenome TaxID=412755 RepID=A0A0F9UTW1_9ZZZZ